jgi:hypothetical protein
METKEKREKTKEDEDLKYELHQNNTITIPHYMLDFLEPNKEYSV